MYWFGQKFHSGFSIKIQYKPQKNTQNPASTNSQGSPICNIQKLRKMQIPSMSEWINKIHTKE